MEPKTVMDRHPEPRRRGDRSTRNRVRFSHNIECPPRTHAEIDVIGEHLGMNNTDVLRELVAEYLHDRPLLAALVAAKLPRQQAGAPGRGRIEWGVVGMHGRTREVRRGNR